MDGARAPGVVRQERREGERERKESEREKSERETIVVCPHGLLDD